MKTLQVILLKPSKYRRDGAVERFESGFMPNATLSHIASLTPDKVGETYVDVRYVDEYVQTEINYLNLLHGAGDTITLLALVGVQSHQFQRAIDLAAYARSHGIVHVVIGGPHPMTCDTSLLHDRGVSFAVAEAELVWDQILQDTIEGELQPVYGSEQRWAHNIPGLVVKPPPAEEVKRYWVPMIGLYPVRGCPFLCNFCSVIKIAGRQVRYPEIASIVESLKYIEQSGIEYVMFTSDNFNKFPGAPELLKAIISEGIKLKLFLQSDTQIVRQPELVDLLGKAGAVEMFIGVESLDRTALKQMRKMHNKPETYGEIVRMCRKAGIRSHFSNIIGFPEQTEQGIYDHLQALIKLDPDIASFYIMTPIPGTEQYHDFRKKGLIYETNLDRFDTTTPTFYHEHIAPDRLQDLLYEVAWEFYRNAMRKDYADEQIRSFIMFCRWAASNRMHHMSGGTRQVTIDRAEDYLDFRHTVFNVGDLLPLPENLELSASDHQFNRKVDWSGKRKKVEAGSTLPG